jgi:hypothetical protein
MPPSVERVAMLVSVEVWGSGPRLDGRRGCDSGV